MALNKLVKRGGSYYEGYELIAASTTGSYILDMTQTGHATINSFSMTPDDYGVGDTMQVSHLSSDGNSTIAILADNIYNQGANATISFDFPALELMAPGERLRLTYTNSAGVSVNVHTIVEYVGMTKTA